MTSVAKDCAENSCLPRPLRRRRRRCEVAIAIDELITHTQCQTQSALLQASATTPPRLSTIACLRCMPSLENKPQHCCQQSTEQYCERIAHVCIMYVRVYVTCVPWADAFTSGSSDCPLPSLTFPQVQVHHVLRSRQHGAINKDLHLLNNSATYHVHT